MDGRGERRIVRFVTADGREVEREVCFAHVYAGGTVGPDIVELLVGQVSMSAAHRSLLPAQCLELELAVDIAMLTVSPSYKP